MNFTQKLLIASSAIVLAFSSSCKIEGFQKSNAQKESDDAEFRAEVFAQISVYRRQQIICGGSVMPQAQELAENKKMNTAASAHASDMNQRRYLSRKSPDGKTIYSRVTDEGIIPCAFAGNIARKDGSRAMDVVVDWMKNREDCMNIMNSSYDSVGFGKSGSYYTLTLAQLKDGCK